MALGVGLACAGCGSQARPRSAGGGSSVTAVAWLRATPPPASWPGLRIPSGAALTYPPSWRRSHGDPGTATVVVRGADGDLLGYLNLTPRQGKETLADWSSFRPDHDRDEGDRSVRVLAAASGLRFPTGHGSCVKDAYTTQTGAHYIEIACLVTGRRTTAVIVGAAPPGAWARVGGDIGRAIVGVRV